MEEELELNACKARERNHISCILQDYAKGYITLEKATDYLEEKLKSHNSEDIPPLSKSCRNCAFWLTCDQEGKGLLSFQCDIYIPAQF